VPQKAVENLMNNKKEYAVYSAEDIEKQKALDSAEREKNWQELERKLNSALEEDTIINIEC
jgi:hypothetical protein